MPKKIIILDSRDGKQQNIVDSFGVVNPDTAKVRYDLSASGVNLDHVKGLGVVSVEMPNTFYNVISRNNSLTFETYATGNPTVALETKTAVLSVGNYNSDELVLELKTQLEAESADTFTVTIDQKTLLLTITNDTASHGVRFVYADSTIGRVLGFLEDEEGVSIVGHRPVDLRGITSVMVKLSGSKNIENPILTLSETNNEGFFHKILVDAPFGGTVFWKASTNIELFPLESQNLNGSITVELMNRNREPVHLNGLDYRIGIMVAYT